MDYRRDLFNASEEDLLLAIGLELERQERRLFEGSDEERRGVAREWIQRHLEACRTRLCASDTVRHLASKGSFPELVAAVSGLLESLALGTAGSPLVIYLCKLGYHRLCRRILFPCASCSTL